MTFLQDLYTSNKKYVFCKYISKLNICLCLNAMHFKAYFECKLNLDVNQVNFTRLKCIIKKTFHNLIILKFNQ